jgi:hypothetical protein
MQSKVIFHINYRLLTSQVKNNELCVKLVIHWKNKNNNYMRET